MKKIAAIAQVTLREALRQKLAVNLLIFAVALVAASIGISTITFGEQYRIIVNLALSSMEIFGTLIAVFLGAGLVSRDVERRTLYPIIAKPVSRGAYVAGRYLGLVATTTLNLLVMAAVFLGVLALYTRGFHFLRDAPLVTVIASLAVQFAMIGAVATFFSCFTTTTLAAIFSLSVTAGGHLATDLVRYWGKQGEAGRWLGRLTYVLVPNLDVLDFKDAVVYREAVPGHAAVMGLGYGVLYAAAVLAFSAAVFARRDLR
ncbi:ABC transporter permease [Anaeromyxobacter paludicola]|uniref:ABC transporter permease n=1 Tax=Anaeromyxobacter paludicola TaxID=2918171 RepID=A0ABN6N7A0_9BACT|nr:ABC transporter permease subunit [Anaeromyxobacter paludicola]BDG09035.1 hypothetical protein AMPC_21480 [Anaeromyxobacter paludicola]